MFKKLFKLYIFLSIFLVSTNCVFAISKRDRYIKKYDFLQKKLSNISADLKSFEKDLKFHSTSLKKIRLLAKKINLKQKKIFSKIRRISKNKRYHTFTSSTRNSSKDSFIKFKSNRKEILKSSKELLVSSDKLSILEEIYQLEKNNHEILEGIATVYKSAAFGNPNSSGVFGASSLIEGNCQPDASSSECNFSFISSTIKIRNLTTIFDSVNFVYYNFEEEALDTTISDKNGNFNLDLEPGIYSIFIVDDGKEYCNNFDAESNACKLIIEEGKKTEYNITIDHSFW